MTGTARLVGVLIWTCRVKPNSSRQMRHRAEHGLMYVPRTGQG